MLLCPWVGAEVVVPGVWHCVRLCRVVSKGNALREKERERGFWCEFERSGCGALREVRLQKQKA